MTKPNKLTKADYRWIKESNDRLKKSFEVPKPVRLVKRVKYKINWAVVFGTGFSLLAALFLVGGSPETPMPAFWKKLIVVALLVPFCVLLEYLSNRKVTYVPESEAER